MSHVSIRMWDGVPPVLLCCCCSADAAVGGGEQCPSADVEGEPSRTAAVGGMSLALSWCRCGRSEPRLDSDLGINGEQPSPGAGRGIRGEGIPAETLRAAQSASSCNARPSLALPAATNSMRRGVQSRCRCGLICSPLVERGGASLGAGESGAGRSGPGADAGGVSPVAARMRERWA